MDYRIDEGSLTLPDGAQDRSVNMLLLNHGPGGLTLVVTRDRLHEGEALGSFLGRQLRALASQVKGFRQQEPVELTVGAARLPAVRVASSFKQNNAGVYQLQTAVLLSTWHHYEPDPAVVELVPRAQHRAPGPVQQSLHPQQGGGFKKLRAGCT